MTLLSIIVLNVGGREHLPKLLNSLSKSTFTDFEIIVADTQELDGNFVKVKLDANYGPPKNRNIAFQHSKGNFILFLDNDTEVLPDTLSKFIEFISRNDNKIVQLKLVRDNGIIDSSGGFIDDLGYPIELGRDESSERYNCIRNILYAKAAAMGMSRKVFEALGGFDNDYFYGYADTDICFRAWKMGIEVVFFPALVIHHEHGSFSKNNKEREERLIYLLESRRFYFILKNFNWKFLLRQTPFITYYFLGSLVMDIVKRRKLYAFKSRLKAFFWVILKIPEISSKRKLLNQSVINEFELKKMGLIIKHSDIRNR
jgi:GT2 family glycosyltransferase